jgi:predicted Zn-dependent protease
VLGYEANYAGTSFATLDKREQHFQYGSDWSTSSPTRPSRAASARWLRRRRRQVQALGPDQHGKLVNYQTIRDQAHILGKTESHGCCYADSWSSVQFQRMANVSLAPGKKPLSVPDLIKDVENGIYIVGDGSFSIDQQRYNAQFGGQLFYEIKNGKITRMLEDVAYQIRTPEFWNACVAVATSATTAWAVRSSTARASRARSRRSRTARPPRASTASTSSTPHAASADRSGARTMSIFTEAQAKAILDKVIALSKADECTAVLAGAIGGNIRYALNSVSTSGIVDNTELAVTVAFGKRVGTASINEFDDAALERVVRRAEDLARLAPENPEFMPAIGKQTYRASPPSANPLPRSIRNSAPRSPRIHRAVPWPSLIAAGFLEDGQGFQAIANSNGNFGYQRTTNFDYTCTVRTEDGRGSGWVGRNLKDAADFKADQDIRIAMRKATESAEAKALEPGKYTVILEPAAAAGLISFMMNFFDARSADEGRSFLSKKGGGNKLGEQVYDPRVTMIADPWHPDAPVLPWDNEGLPRERMAIIENGKVANLDYSRFWAQKQGKTAKASPGNLLMSGGDKSTAELVRGTKKGILVTAPGTSAWSIRRPCC